jgi:V8-like Glu-specific endopeptidase
MNIKFSYNLVARYFLVSLILGSCTSNLPQKTSIPDKKSPNKEFNSQPSPPSIQNKSPSSPTSSGSNESSESSAQVTSAKDRIVTSTNDEKKSIVSIRQGAIILGTGVAIHRDSNDIYILTAAHVLKRPGQEDPLGIYYQDEVVGTINDSDYDSHVTSKDSGKDKKNMGKLTGITDIALIKLPSSEKNSKIYIATLGTTNQGSEVRVVGYITCTGRTNMQTSNGKIDRVKPKGFRNLITSQHRAEYIYDTIYTNNTVKGMSGSPIFDSNSNLVGIHASASVFATEPKKKYDEQTCESLPREPSQDYTNNMGTSSDKIKKFLRIARSY